MLPFHVDRLFGTNLDAAGVAIPKEKGLTLAFHQGDVPKVLLDAKTETVTIDWNNLVDLKINKGILGNQLVIEVDSTEAIRDIPGASETIVRLDLHKRDREEIDGFLKEVQDFRAGKKADDVEAMIDDIRDFLTDL